MAAGWRSFRAVASGYVNAVSPDYSAGNYVDINHGLVGECSVITNTYIQAQLRPST